MFPNAFSRSCNTNTSHVMIYFSVITQVQFLDPTHIEQLRHIVSVWKVPVIAYGLRTDFRTNFFPGSSRLMELADNIEEVNFTETECKNCEFFINLISTE